MNQIANSLLIAGLIIAAALGMTYAEGAGWLADGGDRSFGVIIGIMLAGMGDIMPKAAPPRNGDPGRALRMRRFAGRAFVVAGVAHAAIWLTAPIAVANIAAMGVLAGTLLIVIMRCTVTSRAAP